MDSNEGRRAMVDGELLEIRIRCGGRILTRVNRCLIAIVVPCFLSQDDLRILCTFCGSRRNDVGIARVVVYRVLIIRRVPLTTNVFAEPAIAFAKRIGPFQVSRFVTRGIGVATVSDDHDRWACRFVREGTSVCNVILISFLRIPMRVHVGRTRGSNFVTRRDLIVTFHVKSNLFVFTTINRFPRRTK